MILLLQLFIHLDSQLDDSFFDEIGSSGPPSLPSRSNIKNVDNHLLHHAKTSLSDATLVFSDTSNTILTKIKNGVDVIIPDSCTRIVDGSSADYVSKDSAETLRTIKFPSNLQYIGICAFYNCTLLESIDLSMCTKLTTLTMYSFAFCSLSSVKFPTSLVNFNGQSIRQNSIEYTIQIRASTVFEASAFLNNKFSFAIVESNPKYKMYEGNVYNSDYTELAAVSWNVNVLKLHPSCRTIGYCAMGTTSLTNLVIPNQITKFGDYAVHLARNLVNITIPGSLVTIPANAICQNEELKWITIQEGITTIKATSFRVMSKLETIIFPNSLTTLEKSSFVACPNIKCITMNNTITTNGVQLAGLPITAFGCIYKLKVATIYNHYHCDNMFSYTYTAVFILV